MITISNAGKNIQTVGLWRGQDYLLVKDFGKGMIPSNLFANLPQLLLTQLYLLYNNLFTRKSICREWMTYGKKPQVLRVTNPKGQQKASYYLGLPWTYALLLQAGSFTMHWLASQSIYNVNIAVFDWAGKPVAITTDGSPTGSGFGPDSTNEFFRVGISCLALVIGMAVCVVLLILGWIDDFRRLPSGMSLVGSCSAAISAACHTKHDKLEEMVQKPLEWGIVSTSQEISHCTFTDKIGSTRIPRDGEFVANASRRVTWCPKHWRAIRPHRCQDYDFAAAVRPRFTRSSV